MFFSERYNIVPSKAILINDLRETFVNYLKVKLEKMKENSNG